MVRAFSRAATTPPIHPRHRSGVAAVRHGNPSVAVPLRLGVQKPTDEELTMATKKAAKKPAKKATKKTVKKAAKPAAKKAAKKTAKNAVKKVAKKATKKVAKKASK
jgi:hypothetical protein